MIEWRWGLPPLTARDANARNLAEVLDLSRATGPNAAALPAAAFAPFQAQPCGPQSAHYAHPTAVNQPVVPEVPWPAALPISAAAVAGAALWHKSRTSSADDPLPE